MFSKFSILSTVLGTVSEYFPLETLFPHQLYFNLTSMHRVFYVNVRQQRIVKKSGNVEPMENGLPAVSPPSSSNRFNLTDFDFGNKKRAFRQIFREFPRQANG